MKKRLFLLLTLLMTIAPLLLFVAEIATGRSDGMTSSTLALTIEQKQSFDAQNVELIGQIGGSVEAVAVKDTFAYVGIGPRLVILDISNPSNPTKVGQTEALPDQINDIVISGNYAYVVTSGSGLHIIDVTNQFAPSQVGTFDNGYTYGVSVANNIAYLVNAVGLRLINVSNPATPTEVALLELSGANGVAVADNYAYVTVTDWNNDSGGLHIINVSNSQAPSEVGALDIGKAFSVAVANNYAYVVTQSNLSVVNVANPTTASQVGTIDISFASDVTVVENYAYVADGSSLRIINVSNPQAPNEMKDQHIQGDAKSVVVSNNIALVAASQGGLQLINVTSPSNASRLSTFESWMAVGVAVAGDYAYVANGWNGGLRAIDVANPAAPSEVGSSNTDEENWTDWRRMAIANNNAYLAGGDLSIININSPFAPSEVGTLDTPGNPYGGGVAIAGQIAYLADGEDGGLRLINISNSSAPSQVGALDTPGDARDVAVVGNYAYVADGKDGGLRIMDVANPSAPNEVGFYDTPGDAYSVAIAGNYAYVAEAPAGGLRIIDISNPQAPFEKGAIDTSGWANDVTIVEDLAYVADHHKGLRIIDVTNPIAPTEVGFFDTPGYAVNVTIANGYAYVADRHGGLVVLRYSENTPTPTPTVTPMPTATATPSAPPSWTFMLYLAGDTGRIDNGNVHSALGRALNRLEQNPNSAVNVVALLDGPNTTDTFRVTFNPQAQYEAVGEKQMDNPATLIEFVQQAQSDFPAEHYYLAIADHANGVQGIAWDTTTNADQSALLTPSEIRQALVSMTNNGQSPLDVIHYDGCSFGLLEDVAIGHGLVRYTVASQNIGWSVFAYNYYREAVGSSTTPAELALAIAQRYAERVGEQQLPYTISALDMSRLDSVLTAFNNLSDVLLTFAKANQSNRDLLHNIRSQSQKFDSGGEPYLVINNDDMYVDLVDLAARVKQQVSSAETAADELIEAITGSQPLVIYEESRSGTLGDLYGNIIWNLDGATGVSIYYPPRAAGATYGDYTSGVKFPNFYSLTNWHEYLQAGVPPLAPGDPLPEDGPEPLAPLPVDEGHQIYLPILTR